MNLLIRYLLSALVIVPALYFTFSHSQQPERGGLQIGKTPSSFAVEIGREAILPISASQPLPAAKIHLGKLLFHDKRLSRDSSIACADCHNLDQGGTDRHRFSRGINAAISQVNAPSVFNAGLNFVQFWDGRVASLEQQVGVPITNPDEMDSNWPEVVRKLRTDPHYVKLFGKLYADGISAENISDAITCFERSLLTPSRFDQFLRGDEKAISEIEFKGYQRFIDLGCASCHQGAGLGGNMFQRFGVMGDYFQHKSLTKADLGRFNVTGLEKDKFVFKVPGLRNVAITPPYFHDGGAETLEEAVLIMGRNQLGVLLTNDDVQAIVAFLASLTGIWEGRLLQ